MVQETVQTADIPDPTVAVRFGACVRAARQRQGLTLEALAAAAGISRATLSNLERGEHSPSLTAATNVARALGV
ncbi:MAG: Helix-turn-helix domain, partial [Thermomicrobiales bacterium]|nr:Helix-turn-helix domain [Thermomicrobiales bacterium]